MSRINAKFEELQSIRRKAFIPFIMASFPDFDYSKKLLNSLPELGADLIEIGILLLIQWLMEKPYKKLVKPH